MSTTALVEFVPLRTDLANLPSDLTSILFNSNTAPQNIVVEITWAQGLRSNKKGYLGWSGMTAEKSGSFEIDPTFAQNLGLPHNAKVQISVHINPPVASQIYLEPATTADWEVVETHAAFLENWMINQVRAVSTAHPITVYPSNTAIASLQVTKISPTPPGAFAKLGPDSEVVVVPKVRKQPMAATQIKKKPPKKFVVVRASAFPRTSVSGADTRQLVFWGNYPDAEPFVSVSLVTLVASEQKPPGDELTPAKTVVASFVHVPDLKEPVMSYGLMSALRAEPIGNMVKIQALASTGPAQDVVIHPYTTNSSVKALVLNETPVAKELDLKLVSKGMIFPPSASFPFGGIIDCSEAGTFKSQTMGTELVLAESQVLPTPEQLLQTPAKRVVGIDKILDNVYTSCLSGGGTLAYGSRASGKTVVVEHTLQRLQEESSVYVARFPCQQYLDKPISTVRESLRRTLHEAGWHAPSVVVLEDLDKLIPAQLMHSDSTRTQQLEEVFVGIAHQTLESRKVSLLATAQSKEALSAFLLSSHVFDEQIHIKSPDKRVREAILTEALRSYELETEKHFDILEVVGDTEGYQPGDLWTLVERITSLIMLEKSEGQPGLVSNSLFKQATDEYVPTSLRGVKLQKSSVSWSEIGGLKEVKRVILETLEWPTRYAPIFANCPLRLRSGLLLYGYPGCGKTLMASAVAAQCGLNFISVKGPEILNKYIGASEQSVRDLFDRAQAAKPCVLFFDEFDSIAPKRGHDSTGVTDRVVNQMLTQMDGAEGLDGVYVLAATSRPDLIDGALLRPGRLDKSLLCDMPSQQDRLEILDTARAKMQLAEDIDLGEIAQRTEGFSGADMQAVMTNAYLHAIHASLDAAASKDDPGAESTSVEQQVEMFHIGEVHESAKNYAAQQPKAKATAAAATKTEVVVTWADMEHSLSTTKPSISAKEVNKLRAVYDKFVADRDGQMPSGTSSTDVGGRVTLQ